jgi:hypothetical protein
MNTFRRYRDIVIAACLLGSFLAFGCGKSGQDSSGASPVRKVVQPPGRGISSATEIDRKTFSISLPAGWTEDTKDDMHDPDSFVFFENPESCLFAVVIGKKSAGATVDEQLMNQKEAWLKNITEAKITDFRKWANYEGQGFEIEGKVHGTSLTRQRIFGFEKSDNVCVITESATPGDFKTFASDFETLRQSFKLK